jgi:N-terminal acetyltransferase B complex non-catalytic subunit
MAALVAVDKMIAEKTTAKDSYEMDLYDWACNKVEKNYSKTLGTLRARFVKANPNDKDGARDSFFACVANEDWENGQQVSMQYSLSAFGLTNN